MNKNYYWEIEKSPYPSPFLSETKTFGEANPIFLIDQLGGKRPAVFNESFLASGEINFPIYPSALLDSNIMDAIDNRVQKNTKLDGLENFLHFVTLNKWDFSPLFYYMEHYSKSSTEDFIKNAKRRTESYLKVFSMNQEHFLSTKEIISDTAAVEFYLEPTPHKTLTELAEGRTIAFTERFDKRLLSNAIEAIQITLIKMILIEKVEFKGAAPLQKHGELVNFLKNGLGIMLGREAHMALHYFSGIAGRLLGVQASTPYITALKNIRSTAWDMFLLRVPEGLYTEAPDELCISYIATQEKQLHTLAKLFTLERIFSTEKNGFTPIISYNMKMLPPEISSSATKNDEQLLFSHIERSTQTRLEPPTGLLNALENELKRYCS
ncbi:hypothetical protein RYA98_13055 [Pseudomonas syringae]|uniref:hypothetical protein n=1 Tax=Pseudomonas syringae TaxID=317 RepID=UPI0011413C07|nr:hypothetical protein [Pseudomonas syringae]MDU8573262.1 hypothetical protein [Pseudomonas syringae]